MAQGDTFDVNDGDEIELTFQLNIKQVEVKKRRDANQLTHVKIQFFPVLEPAPGLAGFVHLSALDADVKGDPEKEQVIPITQDDQKFVRLYRVGPIEMFDKNQPRAEKQVQVQAVLSAVDGNTSALVPRNKKLCTLRVRP